MRTLEEVVKKSQDSHEVSTAGKARIMTPGILEMHSYNLPILNNDDMEINLPLVAYIVVFPWKKFQRLHENPILSIALVGLLLHALTKL